MFTRRLCAATAIAVPALLAALPAYAASDAEVQAILSEIRSMKQSYEDRIKSLEAKIETLEKKKQAAAKTAAKASAPAQSTRTVKDNSFNPSIGVILNGRASSFTRKSSEIAGFGVGEEGERGREGLAIDESELNFSANVDDKFYGSLTAAIVREDGSDKVELEEAYVQTLPGIGLPDGSRIKAGRAFWTLGYLNEHHAHSDDFADRPLPYRVYLNKAFNDDGVEASYVLPTDFYSEIGGGVFRGDDFPAGGSASGLGAWSAFARIGGEIGDNHNWRAGVYTLQSDVNSRSSNEDMVTFIGHSDIYAADVRYTFAPTGNPRAQELTAQAEFFYRDEDGTYNSVPFDDSTFGWYGQLVYKFAPAWRVGARYSQLYPADVPAGLAGGELDANGHDPYTISVMGDWTNSEFGRIRLQYNHEKLDRGSGDNQFLVQYVMSIGAHGAHPY